MLLFLLYYINTATVNSLSNGFSNLTRPEMSQEEHFVGDDTTFVFMSACWRYWYVKKHWYWHVTRYYSLHLHIENHSSDPHFIPLSQPFTFFLWCGNNKIIFRSRHRERQSGEWHWYVETSDTVTSCCALPWTTSAFCLSRRRLVPKIFMF